jgi:plastocyanin
MSKPTSGAKVAACMTCLLLASSVRAVDVRGTVRSSEEPKARTIEAVRAPYWQEWNGFIDPKKPSVDFAREVSAALIGSGETRDATTVTLRGGTLNPSTVVVQHGTTLRVRNEDDFAHELYVARIKDFEAKVIGPGQTRSVQMTETGVFEVRDKLSPHVRGFLHVLAKVARVVSPNAEGSFVFEEVPPGDYVVKIFRGANEFEGGTLEVESKGDAQLAPVDVRPTAVKPGK